MTENKQEYAVATKVDASVIETVLVGGDLSKLTSTQRTNYYKAVCDSVGLNPLTKPFDYITLNGKLTLYARKDATDQLRNLRGVSIIKLERERLDGIYTVTAYATREGRQDSSIGAVNIEGIKGDALANALMKAETKAKRRVTLSICGLGMLDETELETIPAGAIQEAVNVRPYPPAVLKKRIVEYAANYIGKKAGTERTEVDKALSDFFMDQDKADLFVKWLTGAKSVKDVTGDSFILAMHAWLVPTFNEDAAAFQIDAVAAQEIDGWAATYEDAQEST